MGARLFPLAVCSIVLYAQPAVTPAIGGPLRASGNRLLESGTPVLLKGTQAPEDLPLSHAGTMFSTIRQRWNMNVVRIPVSAVRAASDASYADRIAELVRRAHQSELAVILAAHEDGAPMPTARTAALWRQWAVRFRDDPRVLFDLFSEPKPGVARDWKQWRDAMQPLVEAVRSAGAQQPVIAMLWDDDLLAEGFTSPNYLADANVIYEVCPHSHAHATQAARDRAFGELAARMPVFAAGWDPELAQDAAECRSLPHDPRELAALLRSHMEYFDSHAISWSASSFTPGKLIFGLDAMEPTELQIETRCGDRDAPVQGMGLEVQLHQWSMTRDNLITVSAGAGAIEIPQGGIAIGYAAITREPAAAGTWPLPTSLGGVRVRVTDAAGAVRWAPLFYAGIGNVNFLIDAETAPGAARIELVREDGSAGAAGGVVVSPVAPGLFTATMNARGPANGVATQRDAAGRESSFLLYECEPGVCRTVAVRLAAGTRTTIRLFGTGFRNAAGAVRAFLGGRPVAVVEAGPQPEVAYNDQLVIEPGLEFAGLGEEDLIFIAGDRVSNVVRLRIE